ncbi:hypothetical protein IAU60_005192 [Kwoniella sp. DSM 27419]
MTQTSDSATSQSTGGPSTLRSRSSNQTSSDHAQSQSREGRDETPSTPRGDRRDVESRQSDRGKQSKEDDSLGGPGLWLPAVKGTIGGIESPRRHMRGSPSVSTVRGDTPMSPHAASNAVSTREEQQEEHKPAPPASVAVFRGDPTVKSCLSGLKMDAKDEIARLFGVA